ncbi:hypothetical protein [Nocardioides jensenii]|uniref:hypothetical protein n=1 Tax=Nocardioides jensenii TaxID=1843 RepID=UPI00082CA790|nr:hypothetical protein [Nocardioides jensenii]
MATEEFVAGVEELYHAGVVEVPDIATRFTSAREHLPGPTLEWAFSRAGSIGYSSHGPWQAWSDLAEDLGGFIGRTERDLIDAGANLVKCAENYAATDDAIRANLDDVRAEIDKEARTPESKIDPAHTHGDD